MKYYWFCCSCGDGPNHWLLEPACICGHEECGLCEVEEVPETFRDNPSARFGGTGLNPPEEDSISETASELSFQDSGYGSASSSSNTSVLLGFAHEIATDLTNNETLRNLLLDHLSADATVNEKFRHLLVQALRKYSFDLKREASTQVQKDSYRLIRSQVFYLAWEILTRLGFILVPSQFDGLQSQQVDKSKILEDYLAKRAQKSVEAETENELEDEISDEEEVDTMPNLSQAKRFLYEGRAFQLFLCQLQNQMPLSDNSTESKLLKQVNTISQLPEGNSNASDWISWYSIWQTISLLGFQMPSRLRRIFEVPSQPGMIRVRWTCRCGKPMYDDYRELVPGAVKEFEQQLVDYFNHAAGGFRERQGAERQPGFSGLWSWITSTFRYLWSSFKRPDIEQLPVTRAQDSGSLSQAAASLSGESLFLLLCAHVKSGHAPRLLQGRTDGLMSDQDFFAYMKELYLRQCKVHKWSSLLSVRKIQDIRFVRFELLRNSLVNIRKNRPMPDSPDYVPYPAVIGTDPPIAGNLLTHLFESPDEADTVLFLAKRIPRKRKNELRICEIARCAEGWGLHLVSGVNWTKVCAVGLLFLAISLVFGIVWSIARKNVSEGFQVTSCLMVLITFSAGTLHGRI